MRAVVAIVLAALAWPAVAQEPASIRAAQTAAGAAVGDPDHPAWDAAPPGVVKIETAFPGHPSIVGTAVTQQVEVRALRTANGLALRLEWSDPVADAERTPHRFADGVAVQFPRDGKPATPPTMGGAGRKVNIWYWNAAKNAAENLEADGFGTLARLPTQDVMARGRHADGKWRVVFFRGWRSKEPRAVRLSAASGGSRPLAFAVWNGSNDERDGFKAVTMNWQSLQWTR